MLLRLFVFWLRDRDLDIFQDFGSILQALSIFILCKADSTIPVIRIRESSPSTETANGTEDNCQFVVAVCFWDVFNVDRSVHFFFCGFDQGDLSVGIGAAIHSEATSGAVRVDVVSFSAGTAISSRTGCA